MGRICLGSLTLSVTDVAPPFLSSLRGGIREGPKIATAQPGLIYFLLFLNAFKASPNKKTVMDALMLLFELEKEEDPLACIEDGRSPSVMVANALPVLEERREDVSPVKMPHVARFVLPPPLLPPSTR